MSIEWCASYHPKKNQPHLHLVFWDKNQNLKVNKMPFINYKIVKNAIGKELFANDLSKLYETKNISKKQIKDFTKNELEDFKNNIKENLKNENLNFNIIDTSKEENLIKSLKDSLKNKEKIYIYNKENPEQFVEIKKNIFKEKIKYYKNEFEEIREELTFKNNGGNALLYKENDFSDACLFLADFDKIAIEKDKNKLEKLINENKEKKLEIDNLIKEIEPDIVPNNVFSNELRNNYFDEIVNRISNLLDFIKKENEKNNQYKIGFRYDYQTATVKNEIDKISNLILSASKDVKKEFDDFNSSSIEVAKLLGEVTYKNSRDYNRVLKNSKDFLYKEMGNQILKYLKENIKENNQEKYEIKKREYEENRKAYKEKQEEFEEKQKEYEQEQNIRRTRILINSVFNILNTNNISQNARCSRLRKRFENMTKEQRRAKYKEKQNSNGFDWFEEQ